MSPEPAPSVPRPEVPRPEVAARVVAWHNRLTAVIEMGAERWRILVRSGMRPPIVGSRFWSPVRLGAGTSLAAVLVVGLAISPLAWKTSQPTAQTATSDQTASAQAAASRPVAVKSRAASAAAAAGLASGVQAQLASTEPSASAAATSVHAAPSMPGPASQAAQTSASIIPNIRPNLNGHVRDQDPTSHFALVSAPLRDQAAAQATLKRLQAEAALIRHPVATQTSVHSSEQGWRVSWWPFVNERQAQNAQAALADRHVQLEVVAF